jgi:glycosyltransferase involved in cell wall biosynthesis
MPIARDAAPGPLVSVVIPTRDRLEFLRRAVASVLAQSEQNLELIVVDDASSDETPAYLTELTSGDSRVRMVRNAQAKGGAGARNEGMRHSHGEWVAFLDDDDEWMPTKLEKQLRALSGNAAAVACSCSYTMHLRSVWAKAVFVPSDVTLQQLLAGNTLGGASMCICLRRVLEEIGGFDAKLKSAQDLDLWVRLRERGEILSCDEALVLLRVHTGPRISSNMHSQYQGARRFYFKHRGLMNRSLRRDRLAYSCFIMSRQTSRGLRFRYRHLLLALLSLGNSSIGLSLSYLRSSAPRLAGDAVCRGLSSLWRSSRD